MKRDAFNTVPAVLLLALLVSACSRDDGTGVSPLFKNDDQPIHIGITPSSAALAPSGSQQFSASVQNRGEVIVPQVPVQWSSSDPSIVSVSQDGLASAHSIGVAYVRAAFGPGIDSAEVRVAEPITVLSNYILYRTQAFGTPSELAIIHPDATGLQRVTTDHFGSGAPDVSPDGRRVVFASSGDGAWAVYIMNVDGTGRTKLVQRSAFDGSPRWSPDGSQIAFRSENDTPFGPLGRIFVINADGSGLRQVSPENPSVFYYDDSPAWSPDGTKIAFSRTGLLYMINADGTGLTALPGEGLVGELDWSPDGTRLAYGNQDGDGNIYLINPDGSNPVAVTATPEYDDFPRWSPDGQRLVFCRVVNDDHFELFVINRDGTGTFNLAIGCSASWSRVP